MAAAEPGTGFLQANTKFAPVRPGLRSRLLAYIFVILLEDKSLISIGDTPQMQVRLQPHSSP